MVKIGLAVMVFAGFADVVAHLGSVGHEAHLHEHASAELQAHFAGFVGMVVVFVGVVADGVRSRRLRSSEPTSKGVV
jgi:membrane associated rhomboid family serine protease